MFQYCKILFLFLFQINITLFASNKLDFNHISIEKGLSQSIVYSIYQDSKGFMWFGTLDGLNKFDGFHFEVYRCMRNGDTTSISDNQILELIEDNDNNLWVGTARGLSKINLLTNEVKSFYFNKNKVGKSAQKVRSIYFDKKNILWLGTDAGLIKFNISNYQYKYFDCNSQNVYCNNVWSVNPSKDGGLWVGTTKRCFKFNETSGYENVFSLEHYPNLKTIRYIFEDNRKNVWISTDGSGLFKYSQKDNTLKHYIGEQNQYNENKYRQIYQDSEGLLWISTYNGLKLYDYENDDFQIWQHNENEFNTISSNKLISLYEDKSGLLWIGSYGGGLNIANKKGNKFGKINSKLNEYKNLSSNIILSILYTKDDLLYIGTDKGLNVINLKSKTLEVIKSSKNGLSENVIYALTQDKQGNIWIGTGGGALNKYNPKTKSFKKYNIINKDYLNELHFGIRSLFFDNDIIWIGSYIGLSKFDIKTEQFQYYQYDPKNPYSLSSNIILHITKDKNDLLWISTEGGGFNIFDNKNNSFEKHSIIHNYANSISDNVVRFILPDSNDIYWIATSKGLNKFNFKTKQFKVFNTSHGLSNNLVYSIIKDKDKLWMSTNMGLSQFDIKSEVFTNFTIKDGLQSNEFNQACCFKNYKNEIYFGGINGINMFYPENIVQDKYIPSVCITDIMIYNKSIKEDIEKTKGTNIPYLKNIEIPYSQNVFSIYFASLHYLSPDKNKFSYMLEGFDKDWIDCETRRMATYTNLSPGKYVFKIKATNSDGVWNETPTELEIRIIPPLWLTTWFIILVICLIIFVIIIIIKKRERSLKIEKLVLERKVLERTIEIEIQNKEIASQRDVLKELNYEMVQQHEKIMIQSIALEKVNKTLEERVKVELEKNREKELLLMQQSRHASMGEMIGNIAHQWRQPLNAIAVIIQNFQEAHDYNELNAEYVSTKVKKAMEIINFMSQTIDSFRHFFKPDKEKVVFEIEEVVSNTISFIDASFKNSNIQIKINKAKGLYVLGFPNEFSQVILNILNNAKDVLIERYIVDPIVSIDIFERNKKAFIRIADNAGGIHPESMNKIFEPYFTTKEEDKGTGLGLYMSKMIIERNMQGRIFVDNNKEGAEFVIEIDLYKRDL